MATPYREKLAQQPRKMPLLPFLLPLPLLVTLLFALAGNRFFAFAISLTGVSLYLLSAYFLSRANFYESEARTRKWAPPSRTPWRFSAALFTAIATAQVAYYIVDHGLLVSGGYGLIAFVGMAFHYGLDQKYEDASTGLVGVTSEELTDAFDEAEAKIASIRESADKVRGSDSKLATRLEHIAVGSEDILKIITEDPSDLRRARKFLKVYLDGAQKVVSKYVSKKHVQDNVEIESNLREVLDTIDTVIEEQRVKLLENDMLELDVQIEVLQTQLKHEGIS